MERTRTVSDRPGTLGRRQEMPRTIRSMPTPACDASYSRSIIPASDKAFILATILPLVPYVASLAMSSSRRGRRWSGATMSFS
jgi:hypothetical protein